jgi:hypothetical protein
MVRAMPRVLATVALIALAVALGVSPIGAGARSTLLTGNRPALVTSHERPERVCTRLEVRALFFGFVDAFNKGDLRRLNRLFALEPGFEWYSTHAPGERFDNAAKNRSTLIPYFRERHAMGERLKVRSLRIKGRDVQYSLIRSADDLEPTRYDGKAAARCYVKQPKPDTAIVVWSMGPA